MRASQEITDQGSCMNRALPEEMTFVLLGRDPAAPAAIQAWIDERVRLGKNGAIDHQLIHAESCAQVMELERVEIRKKLED